MLRFAALLLMASALACGSGASEGTSAAAPVTKSPTAPKKSAYPAERVVGAKDLGPAAGDFDIRSHEGTISRLADAWKERYAVVVFYRGHW